MKIDTRVQYIADDGTAFNKEEDCLAYEVEQADLARRTSYWKVIHSPDLTEGRGFYGHSAFKLVASTLAQEFMEDFCFARFGRRVEFIQGVSPMPNWILTQIDKVTFDRPVEGSVGCSKIKGKKFLLKFEGNSLAVDKEL